MCTSKAEGGQRCYSNVKAALAKAHEKKVATEVAYTEATQNGASTSKREGLLRRAIAADYDYQDALAQYASTDKGRADLEERRANAPAYHQHNAPNDPNRGDDEATLRMAISEGKWIAQQAAEIKRAVRAGEMSPEAAEERATYPNAFAVSHRERSTAATIARVLGTGQPQGQPRVPASRQEVAVNDKREQVIAAVKASADGASVESVEEIADVLMAPKGTKVFWLADGEDGEMVGWATISETAANFEEGGYADIEIETADGDFEEVPAYELSLSEPKQDDDSPTP